MSMFTDNCWLIPWEQEYAIGNLSRYDLINHDNNRSLPLKKGGTTDIYANLRLMRNHAAAIDCLARLYENPLRRLNVDRIVEVPEAVSPLAGAISVRTGIPIVTIREQEKAGRVVKGQLIGDIKFGDRVAILDDVITDGASKLGALRALRAKGAKVVAIVVLVDRQQGWKKTFADNGFGDVEVWAGMTLHDVRKHLVKSGQMRRCDPAMEEKNTIIVALDGLASWEEAVALLDPMRPTGCIFKMNDLTWVNNINRLIDDVTVYGRVMLDPKLHDIPNTVKNFCEKLRATPPWAVTAHASGGTEMLKAALGALEGTNTLLLAITLLTSLSEEGHTIYTRRPLGVVKKLATLAYKAGVRGFVCSTKEAAWIRSEYPDAKIVVPALRSPGNDAQDQKRVATFTAAQAAGADFFVGGRQFLTHPAPVGEVHRVLREELNIQL